MPKLKWDEIGERQYETGTDHGVVYPFNTANKSYDTGVAWNGLTAVTENPSGAEANPLYADNIKYVELRSAEEFGATIEAFMYPDEFAVLDGSAQLAAGVYVGQQKRGVFGFCYRTRVGNDTELDDYGYKLHLVYGAVASPSEKNYGTVNESPDAVGFSWEVTTTPVNVTGFKPTAHLVIDSTKADAAKLAALEDILYGTENTNPRLPLPDEIRTLMIANPLASIAIVNAPTNTSYTAGQLFNPAGMTVKAVYEDATQETIFDYTFSPTTALATTDTAVTVSYTKNGITKTATQAITVTAA